MISLIPFPVHVQEDSGTMCMSGRVTITCDDGFEAEAAYLKNELSTVSGVDPSVASSGIDSVISLNAVSTIQDEGYELTIKHHSIEICASSTAGMFYGVITCVKLGREAGSGLELPCLRIADAPRFSWRGLHLDVGRHMFPVEDIKRLIDHMAALKLNRFHWHLTEDQGWRIAINRYPELTKIGSKRSGPDGDYGGFYTKDEVREVVAHAKANHIEVVPEIEMPGHSQSVLSAFPELSCTGGPFAVMDTWGISKEVFCAGNDAVFELLFNVLDEIIELFPYQYIHIGGDECPKERWSECSLCAERIAAEKLSDVHELQSWFIRKVEQYLLGKGKSIIGWDEILEGGLAPNAAVMSWRGIEGGVAAAKAGHAVVMSPTEFCYFDYPQSSAPGEPGPTHFSTPVISTKKVYSFEPIPPELTEAEGTYVLGAQANLWTESIPTTERLEYMTFPRVCALAEVVWSPIVSRDWGGFKRRLESNMAAYQNAGVNACADPEKWE